MADPAATSPENSPEFPPARVEMDGPGAERAVIEFARRRTVVTAGEGFVLETVTADPPRAVWRAQPSAGSEGASAGALRGSYLLLSGADRPRVGAPLAERLDFLAQSYGEQAQAGARTPLGLTQPLRRDASAVYLPFIADQGLPDTPVGGPADPAPAHFMIVGTSVAHVIVHMEMVRRLDPGVAAADPALLEETLRLAQGRVMRLRAANGLAPAGLGLNRPFRAP